MGGRAFPGSSPLFADEARAVLDELRALLPWRMEECGSACHFSAGRRTIPDLDLVVLEPDFDRAALERVGEVRGYTLGGAGLRYVRGGRWHQVDFFPVATLEWGRFARAGAPDSGAARAVLLKAAAATFEQPGVDFSLWHGDVTVLRAGRTLDQRAGLRRIFQHRLRRDGRRGLLRAPKTVDAVEFARLTGRTVPEVPTIANPDVVRATILGAVDADDSSAQSLAAHMRATFPRERLQRVRAKVRERGFDFDAALAGSPAPLTAGASRT